MACSKVGTLVLFVCSIGAINWGMALVNFNLVTWLAQIVRFEMLTKILYVIIGLAGVYGLFDSI